MADTLITRLSSGWAGAIAVATGERQRVKTHVIRASEVRRENKNNSAGW